MTDQKLPQRIGDYEILGVLGKGGMGEVYEVRNVISDRVEAMKVLLPNLEGQKDLAERFLREIKVLASLNHPNIAALRTAFMDDNRLVMIMEYLEGETLAARLEAGQIPIGDSLNYIDAVLSALAYAHQHDVIHRDIKPGNIMLTPDGNVKLMDFGIARSEKDANLTITGTALGSLNYMPPEQIQGGAIDARSDLYSVGVTLYQLVTGQPPFKGDSNYSIMAAHLNQVPKRPIELRADLPQGLNEIILMAMAKEPGKRFQSTDAFRNALHSVTKNFGVTTAATAPISVRSAAVVSAASAAASSTPAPSATPTPTPSPAQPVATASQKITPPPPAQSTGHRGLYIALGAAIVLIALVAAGFTVPRWIKARAANRAAVTGGPATDTQPSGAAQAPATPSGDISNAPNPNAAPAEAPAGDTGANTPNPPPSDVNVAPAPAANPAPAAIVNPAPAKHRAVHSENPAPQQSEAPPAAPQPPPVDTAKLAELGHQMDLESSRAAAAKSSLDQLKAQMARQGLGIRGDIAGSEARMDTYLSRADAALQAQDTENAKKYLDLAESELGKIEKFLGH